MLNLYDSAFWKKKINALKHFCKKLIGDARQGFQNISVYYYLKDNAFHKTNSKCILVFPEN